MIDAAILQGMHAFSLVHPETTDMTIEVVAFEGWGKSVGLPFHC
jgi:hypothetical protein